MWNDDIILLKRVEKGKDKLRQPVFEEVESLLACNIKSVSRNEFYQAQQADLRPTLIVEIHPYEYERQEFALIDGVRYRILKSYKVNFEILELTLTEVL